MSTMIGLGNMAPGAPRSRPQIGGPRFIGNGDTPTPPPVAVALDAPRNERISEPILAPSPHRGVSAIPWLAVSVLLGALAAIGVLRMMAGSPALVARLSALAPRAGGAMHAIVSASAQARAPALPAREPAPMALPRADEHVAREGYAPIRGGVLFVPKTFTSADGAYDLLLHFHGNTHVVLESAEHAGLDAIVAVVNLGTGSGPYEDAYKVPGKYEALLGEIDHALAARGLGTPHLRRLALSSWSAGYGAISTILQQRKSGDRLDAIAVLDGIHVGYQDENPGALNARNLAPFIAAARLAAGGGILFTITHSAILPVGYASTTATANLLLEAVGGQREVADPSSAPEHLNLPAATGAVSKKLEKWMNPDTEARVGDLHVRGYRGGTPEDHMAHLLQMGATVLPEIAARWGL